MRAALPLATIALAGLLALTFLAGDAGPERDVGPFVREPAPRGDGALVQAPPAVRALRRILHAERPPAARLDAAPPTLRGRVVDARGRPTVADVVLVEAGVADPARHGSGFAASSFDFRPARAGRWWLLARGPEGVSRAWLELDPRRPERQALVLQLEGRGRLRGTLADAEGRPLADWPLAFRLAGTAWEDEPILDLELEVRAQDDDYEGPGRTWAFARTDAVGAFEVRGLRPGVWSIRTSRVGERRSGEHVLARAVRAEGRPLPLVLPVHRLRVGVVDERLTALANRPSLDAFDPAGLRLWTVAPGGWRRVYPGWRPTGLAHVWETFLAPDELFAVTFGSSTRALVHSDPIPPAERGTSEVELRAAPAQPSARVRVRLAGKLDERERELVMVTLDDARHGVPMAAQLFALGVDGDGVELELGPIPAGVYDLTVGGLQRVIPELAWDFDPDVVVPSLWRTRLVVPPGGVSSVLASVEPRGELRVPTAPGRARLEREGESRSPRRVDGLWVFDDLRPGPWRLRLHRPDGSFSVREVDVLRSRVTR